MRNLMVSLVLVLFSLAASASPNLPLASISQEGAGAILNNWEARAAEYQAQLALKPVGDPARGELLAIYLNAAFADAGYSLDKTFNLWLSKVKRGPEIARFPELHQFALTFGFVDLMAYLSDMGIEHRAALLRTGVFSQETADLTSSSEGGADRSIAEEAGAVKADSYYECTLDDEGVCE